MACTQVIRFDEVVYGIDISSNGELLAIGMNKSVQLLTRYGNFVTTLNNEDPYMNSITFSPAGFLPSLLATSSSVGFVRVWDCDSGACVARLESHLSKPMHCAAFSPNGRLLAATSGDQYVQLWRTDDWSFPSTVLVCDDLWPLRLSFSCDSRLLVADTGNMLWRILDSDVPTAVSIAVKDDDYSSYCMAFSPTDNNLLARGGEAGSLVLSRVGESTVVGSRVLQGHTRDVWDLAFSPCGKQLASVTFELTVRVWNVASGACLHVLPGHTRGVSGVAFFPNGKQLATLACNNIVRIWTVCAWRDFTHQLFGTRLKAAVFNLMCVRAGEI